MASTNTALVTVMVVVATHRQDATCIFCREEACHATLFYLDSEQYNAPIPRGKGDPCERAYARRDVISLDLCRSLRAAVIHSVVGALVGMRVGAVAGVVVVPLRERLDSELGAR